MRFTVRCLVLSLLTATAFAEEAGPKPEQVIGYRQALYKTIGWNFLPMGAMVKGTKPWDGSEFKRRSIAVAFAAVQLNEAFAKGSDRGAVTDALPAIWENPEDFAAKLKAFQQSANSLRVAAAAGDQEQVRTAFGEVRKTCGDCHESYRAE